MARATKSERIELMRDALTEISQATEEWGDPTAEALIAKGVLVNDDTYTEDEEVDPEISGNPLCPDCKNPMPNASTKFGAVKLHTCVNRECLNKHWYHTNGARAYE